MTASRQQQFQTLLEQHRKIVFKVANTYSNHPEDRADLAQEIAAQLWKAFPQYDSGRVFSTWMYRIALNVAISFLRSSQQRTSHTEALEDHHNEVIGVAVAGDEDAEPIRLLNRIIQQLEPLNRALLLLYLEERSQRDIAEVLGISESNVATKIQRLKQRIRLQMTATENQQARRS